MHSIAMKSSLLHVAETSSHFHIQWSLSERHRRVWWTAIGMTMLITTAVPSTTRAELLAENDSAIASYETPATIDVLSNDDTGDESPDPTTVTIITQPSHGTVSVDPVTGGVTYTPNDRFAGSDTFEYSVDSESSMASASANVDVDVRLPDPPEILSFTIVEGAADVWHFDGTVSYDHPEDLTITFGDLLAGHSVTVKADGTFSYYLILDNGEEGLVSATTTDEHGQTSNEVFDSVIRF